MFSPRRDEQRAQALLTKIANHHCTQVHWLHEGPREELRVPLTMAVYVVPCIHGQPQVDLATACVTKEIATRGIAVTMPEPFAFDEALVGMSWEGQMWWMHTQVRHVSPLGAGIWQVGLQIGKLLEPHAYGALKNLVI
jgi:hypothetical protein